MTATLYTRILFLLIALGLALRLFPAALGQPWLAQYFVTEDGYLMLTVARNLAIGLGMSVSEGTIPTNGVQPLATFLFAIPYWLTGGDKTTSLIGIHLIAAAAALGAVFTIRALAARVLEPQDDNPVWPWLVAALWFIGPLFVYHSMNALETGIYTFAATGMLVQFARVLDRELGASLGDRLLLGALCGIAFLSRNDAAFLVVAVFAFWAIFELFVLRAGLVSAFVRLFVPGLACLAIAAPWMIFNKINFGSIVPISGSAQSFGADFGQNLPLVPAKLFEGFFPMLPIPASLEERTVVMAFCLVVVLALTLTFTLLMTRRGGSVRFVVYAYLAHGLALSAYYGLYFGAPHFLSRYLSITAPLAIIASVSVLLSLAGAVFRQRRDGVVMAVGLAGLALAGAILVNDLRPGQRVQGHFQVVDWITTNVPDDTWVGAVQTGTLGYWHDRTINLDGKVNPAALAELQAVGNVYAYVVASPIQYLADWHGISVWPESTEGGFNKAFELVTEDAAANLAVLKRKGAGG